MKKLKLKITPKGTLKLTRGKRSLSVRGRKELEDLAHQALDLAIGLADFERSFVK